MRYLLPLCYPSGCENLVNFVVCFFFLCMDSTLHGLDLFWALCGYVCGHSSVFMLTLVSYISLCVFLID